MRNVNTLEVKRNINNINNLTDDIIERFKTLDRFELARRAENEELALIAQKGVIEYLAYILDDIERAKELLDEEIRGLKIREQRVGVLKLLCLQRMSNG